MYEASVLELVTDGCSYLDLLVACGAAGVESGAFVICGGPVGDEWVWLSVGVGGRLKRVWVFINDGVLWWAVHGGVGVETGGVVVVRCRWYRSRA